MKIYLDIILFENLCMNYIILCATGIVMKSKIKHIKFIISSLIGSLYAIVVYLKISNFASNIIMKIVLSIVMIWVAFDCKNFKNMFKYLLMFYLISFVFGGCSFALIYFVKPENIIIRNGVLVGLYPIKVTLIAGAIAFIVIQIAFKITKNKLSANDMMCFIELYFEVKKIKIKALIDSGNMLKEPISGYPVIVVERDKIEQILPSKLIKLINNIERGEQKEQEINEFSRKIRLIPFSSLGKQNGMLIGIKMEKIKIDFKDTAIYVNKVIAGIYNKKLTKENKYNALIGIGLIGESEENEYISSY